MGLNQLTSFRKQTRSERKSSGSRLSHCFRYRQIGQKRRQSEDIVVEISVLFAVHVPMNKGLSGGKSFACFSPHKLYVDLLSACLLINLYAGQEATVRTGHGTTDWFKIGKGVCQGCVLSPCLFNLYAEYIMRNAGLEETQAGIKIAGRSVSNLGYADNTTLMAESEEELKSLLMKVESGKVGLKLNIQKTKIMASGPITSWQIDGETVETVSDFIFLGSKSLQMVTAAMKLKDACSLEGKL
uniref:RNA-directed DNA polymerase n=1 Tax=Bos indicus x Bos taurus TaxID=30522 RepID=A0A4W2HYL6_BOBOX